MTGADTTVFALLDDSSGIARAGTGPAGASRLYTGFAREHRCTDPATLGATWAAVEADQSAGLHAVVLADYEWGAKLMGAGRARLGPGDASSLRVLMFRSLARLDNQQTTAWLQAQDEGQAELGPAGALDLHASVDRAAFTAAIDAIHEAIRAGETYQVNYTYRLFGRAFGSPVSLYRRLRARQPVSYGAFIALPPASGNADADAVTHVLSLSPELFLRHEAGLLTAKPMKGTAARRAVPEGDSEAARLLSLDIKNRAENLMIVDLLRNDLGRIARVGSVKVPALFAIEPYSTVFQMTSTVQAQVLPTVDMPALLRAVFPCGSITGAPKHHTMDLIASLESTPRGLYCGSIGWVDAPPEYTSDGNSDGPRLGNFCFSVAIRTLTLRAPDAQGLRPLTLGIGAGIVLDSVAHDEFDECRLKARFFTRMDPGFQLVETLRFEPATTAAAAGVQRRAEHLQRLARSAAALGFRFDDEVQREVHRALDDLPTRLTSGPSTVAHRVRLALAHDGHVSLTHAPLAPLPVDANGAVALCISPHVLPQPNPLALHKTTLRTHYDAAVRQAEAQGAFDSLFFNTAGHLVEGGRSNVFVKLGGRWCTPPLSDGVLPGVMRQAVLDDPAWAAVERVITRDALARAEGLMVCNALRGALPARLLEQADGVWVA